MSNSREVSEFHILVAAAGRGERMGKAIPKQYAKIYGKSILCWTLENLLRWRGFSSVRVIIGANDADLYHEAVAGLDLSPPVIGGAERKDSIFNALKCMSHLKNEDIILIHDAVRPFASLESVQNLINEMQKSAAASLAIPVTDTLRREEQIIDRSGLWALQTPQAFQYGLLMQAHEQAKGASGYTDDTSLVSETGIPVKLVEGSRSNFKITTPDDLHMAEALLLAQTETRTGMGFDVHAFEAGPKTRPLKLCGITVEHGQALAGHSDADVGLHALTDALLGTIGAGDIGTHFPPSNPAYKDMDSRVFLEKSVELLKKRGGSIVNLDITLICEEPKISPHSAAMKMCIAEITGLEVSRISIKATTTEKLGFTGRGEGIAAQAIATVRLPCL